MKGLFSLTVIASGLLTFCSLSNAALILSTGTAQSPLPIAGNDFNTDMQSLGYSEMIIGSQISVDQAGSVTFTYIAAESGFTNSFNLPSGASITENNDAFDLNGYGSLTINVTAGEILSFNFTSLESSLPPVINYDSSNPDGSNLAGLGIFTDGSGLSHQQVILGYDDLWKYSISDDNHDDMMVLVDFKPVPVPAALWLFGSGLLGLVGVARLKKA